jgi:5-methylcytosine-specific restriction protein A
MGSMEEIDSVLKKYPDSSTEIVSGKSQRRRVSSDETHGGDYQIKTELPELVRNIIKESGRSLEQFRVYGSVGQINFPIAKVPWVSALKRDITTSTERGYYIVLLFREDMKGCVLSLNQGFTQRAISTVFNCGDC